MYGSGGWKFRGGGVVAFSRRWTRPKAVEERLTRNGLCLEENYGRSLCAWARRLQQDREEGGKDPSHMGERSLSPGSVLEEAQLERRAIIFQAPHVIPGLRTSIDLTVHDCGLQRLATPNSSTRRGSIVVKVVVARKV